MPEIEATLDNILDERLRKLVWEGWRRQDLIRFGGYGKFYDIHTPTEADHKGNTTVFPIPEKVRELNGNMKQNPGYRPRPYTTKKAIRQSCGLQLCRMAFFVERMTGLTL